MFLLCLLRYPRLLVGILTSPKREESLVETYRPRKRTQIFIFFEGNSYFNLVFRIHDACILLKLRNQ